MSYDVPASTRHQPVATSGWNAICLKREGVRLDIVVNGQTQNVYAEIMLNQEAG